MPLTVNTWPASTWLRCPVEGCHSKVGGAPTLEVPHTVGRRSDEIQEQGPFYGICASCGHREEGIPLETVQDAYEAQAAQRRGEGY